jgi:uncharacterized protein YbjT (DUF2867 family)
MKVGTSSLITVFGGTGYLGRAVVRALLAEGRAVRVAVRRPAAAERLFADLGSARIEAVAGDVREPEAVAAAVEGAEGVVNAVGHYRERPGASFAAVHVWGAESVAKAARRAGAGRLVLISGIGADPASPSAYVRARAGGERVVREAFPAATVLRPSVLFGPGDAFLGTLSKLIRGLPVIPLFGSGRVRLQPVHVDDVASAVVRSLDRPDAPGGDYELGGADVVTYREVIEHMLRREGRRRILLPVPFGVWHLAAGLLSPLPAAPVTRDQLALLAHDNVVAAGARGLADLGIEPRSLVAWLAGDGNR